MSHQKKKKWMPSIQDGMTALKNKLVFKLKKDSSRTKADWLSKDLDFDKNCSPMVIMVLIWVSFNNWV